MNKTVFGFGFQVFIGVNLWFFLVYKLNRVDLFILALVVVILLFVMVRGFTFKSNETLLELDCESSKYLSYIEDNHKKLGNDYHIAKAYGLLYAGDIENSRVEFDKYDSSNIKYGDRFFLIYIKMRIKFAFYDNKINEIENIVNEYQDKFVDDDPLIQYAKVFGYILIEDHKSIVDTIVKVIPNIKERNIIVELEYYLAKSYIVLEQEEDAKAVLDFVIWKDYHISYTEKCKELLNNTYE